MQKLWTTYRYKTL